MVKTSGVKTSQTIFIGKEAHIFLERESRKQRGCKPLSAEAEERAWARKYKNEKGMCMVDDNSYGGGDGTYNGKWWLWKVETVRAMLDEAGIPYEVGETVEYIDVYL